MHSDTAGACQSSSSLWGLFLWVYSVRWVFFFWRLPKQLWPVGFAPVGVLCAVGGYSSSACQSSSDLWALTLWVYSVRWLLAGLGYLFCLMIFIVFL